ncbi:MAG: hypothetical protein PH343_06490, partial [Nitrospira sp.]|nr:hypothetical protein [Nitrospira sp.]
GWDAIGNVSTSDDETAVLETGGVNGLYETSLSTSFVISGDSMEFRYYFDITGIDEIKYPDFPSFGPDFFQMTLDAGTEAYFDIPLAWSSTGGFVPFSIDISYIKPGTMARLTFLLFDEDDQHSSIAVIDDISDPSQSSMPVQEPQTVILLGAGLIGVFVFSRHRGVRKISGCILMLLIIHILNSTAYAELQEVNVDDKAVLEFTYPVFDTRTNTLTLNMSVTNISNTTILQPMKVVITGISSPDVTVSNPGGYTSEGLPYFNMDSYVGNAGLLPGEKSQSAKISFQNPKRVKFRWDQDIIAFVDMPVDTGPVIFNLCVVPGERPPVCEFTEDNFDAENPEFERILQNTMPEMYLYEQVRVYAFDYNDLPVKVMINGNEAAYNEDGFYYYSDLTLNHGSNTLTSVVTNDAGLSTGRDIKMSIDSIMPVINILNLPEGLPEGFVVTSPEIVLNGTVDDPEINTIRLRKDFITSEDVPVVNSVFNADVILSAGHNNLSLEAVDRAGNSGTYNLDIILNVSPPEDSTPDVQDIPVIPDINILPPPDWGNSSVENLRSEFAIYAQEAGLVPLEMPVIIESTQDIPLKDYNLGISGNNAANIVSDGELHYKVSITEPGVYTLAFNATDPAGNVYRSTFRFTGMAKGDSEAMLRQVWDRFKDSLIAGNTEEALLLLMPDTRLKYREQLSLLSDLIPEIFAGIGEIQLISLKDNEAKARIYEGEITHYVWFAKDLSGLWKIHKF